MSNNQPKPYQVYTQFLYSNAWRTASDRKGCETIDEAHIKGRQLVVEQRKDLVSGIVVQTSDKKIPRRYVIAQIVHVSEAM